MSDNMYSVMLIEPSLTHALPEFPLGTASLSSRLDPSLSCRISLLQLPCCPTRYNSASFPVRLSAYCIPTNNSSLNRSAGSPTTRTRPAYRQTPSSTWPASAKPMATSSMAMLLWERGKLDLDEPLGRRVPEFLASSFDAGARAALRSAHHARMLLAHCSGLPAYAPLYKTCGTAR